MFTSIIHSIVNDIMGFMTSPSGIFSSAITLVLIGLVYSFVYWIEINADRKSKNWPSVSGKITSSRIEEKTTNSYGSGGHLIDSVSYVPVVKYSYHVAETLYHAERIGNSIYSGITPKAVERWVKRFPANTTIPVYYNPADPSDAILIPTTNSNIFGFIMGIAISALGVFLVGLWIFRLFTSH